MCYNGTFRFKKLDDSFWNGETFRFADYTLIFRALHSVDKSEFCIHCRLHALQTAVLFLWHNRRACRA